MPGTRTADIAAAAGVTERTLFRYFPSKENLSAGDVSGTAGGRSATRADRRRRPFRQGRESFAGWHRRVLQLRVAAAKQSAPQFRLLISSLMTEG